MLTKYLAALLALLLVATAPLLGQTTTTVSDTFVGPDGAPVQLRMSITPNSTFNTADGYVVPVFSTASVASNGSFSVRLVPNTGTTPAGSSYRVDYSLNGIPFHETWVVPQSSTPVKLAAVRTLIPPPLSSISPAQSPGDLYAISSSLQLARVPTNASSTPMFLSQSSAAIPSWVQPSFAQIGGTLAANQVPNLSSLNGSLNDSQLASPYSGVGSCAPNQFAVALGRNVAPACATAVTSSSAPTNQFAVGISAAGNLNYSQPTFLNLAGVATPNQLPNLSALNGTLNDTQLASPYSGVGACAANQFATSLARNGPPTCGTAVTASTAPPNQFATGVSATGSLSYGSAVQASLAPANQFATGLSAGGTLSYAQPSFSNLAGSISPSQLPVLSALTGTLADTQLANSYSGVGTCTNQAVIRLSRSAGPGCGTITSAFVDTSIATTGGDLNTSSQVVSAHFSGGTPNAISKFSASGSPVPSSVSDNGTQVSLSENIQFPLVTGTNGAAGLTPNAASGTFQFLNYAGLALPASANNASHFNTPTNAAAGTLMGTEACTTDGGPTLVSFPSNFRGASYLQSTAGKCVNALWFYNGNSWDLAAQPHGGFLGWAFNGNAGSAGPVVQYVGPLGSDTTNDGTTPQTPVATLYQAVLNIQGVPGCGGSNCGGTIYVADNSYLTPFPNEGLHIFGGGDPNYAGCSTVPCIVSGYHWLKVKNLRIVGMGGAYTANSDQPASRLLCNQSFGNCIGPDIQLSSLAGQFEMENIFLVSPQSSPFGTFVTSVDSTGNINGAGGVANVVLNNVQVGGGNSAGVGPAIFVGANSFEQYYHHVTSSGNTAEAYPISSCVRAANSVTCTVSSGTFSALAGAGYEVWLNGFADGSFNGAFLATSATSTTVTFSQPAPNATSGPGYLFTQGHFAIYVNPGTGNSSSLTIRDSHLNTGGIAFISGSSNWDLLVENTYTENEPTADVGVWVQGLGVPGDLQLNNFRIADNGPGVSACRVEGSIGGFASDSMLGVLDQCTSGPSTIIQTYPGAYGNAGPSPEAYGSVGFLHGHVLGQTDAARRNFPPTLVRWPNQASQLPGSWTVTGGTLTTITGPDGVANGAGQLTSSGTGFANYGSITATWNPGDFVVAGQFEAGAGGYPLGASPGAVLVTTGSCSLEETSGNLVPGKEGQFQGYIGGDGEWVWETHVWQVYQGGACTLAFSGQAQNTGTKINFAYPVFFRVPQGTASASEVAEYARHMNAYPDTAAAGDVTTGRGQRFSFGTPGSNYFGKFTSAPFSADRTFTWPDASGTVATFTGPAASGDCVKWITATQVGDAGSPCGGGGGATPGGSNTQVQYNNNGALGGIGNWTTDGNNVTAGTNFNGGIAPLTIQNTSTGSGSSSYLFFKNDNASATGGLLFSGHNFTGIGGDSLAVLSKSNVYFLTGGSLTTRGYFDSSGNFAAGGAAFLINPSGQVTKYAGAATAGIGLAPFVYSNTLTAQTASLGNTMVTPASSALYRFTGEINCTTASASSSVTLTVSWTDTSATAQSLAVTANCTTLGSASFADMIHAVRSKNGAPISWNTSVSGTPTYDVDIRLQSM